MDRATKKLVEKMDVPEFYREVFDEWDGESNVSCPFAVKRHAKGTDGNPSFVVFRDTGGTYCHGCGYKAGNPAVFYADLKGISIAAAQRVLWSRYVELLVPDEEWQAPARRLQQNVIVLKKLLNVRGLTKVTAIKFHLGYDGKRLTIPVFNEEGYCVNLRRYDLYKEGGPKMVSWKKGFGKSRLYPDIPVSGDIFVVEGELDALTGRQMGIQAISPSGGALTWRPEFSKSFAGRSVYIVPDDDDAGRQGAELRWESIKSSARSGGIVQLPKMDDGKDLTDWVLRHDGTKEKLIELVKKQVGAPINPVTVSSRDSGQETPLGKCSPVHQSTVFNQGSLKMEAAKDEGKLVERAQMVWGHLAAAGKFFRNYEGELYYVQEDKEPIRVTDAPGPFMAMLTRLSPLINQATITGRFVFKYLQNNTFAWGELSKTGVWTLYDAECLYVHAGAGKIIKVDDIKFTTIKNAVNEDHVLLDAPTKGISINEIPTTMPAEGLKCLKDYFLESMPMPDEDRYFLLCWLSGVFLRDYIRPKPIIRLLASTASGKSTVSKLVSTLVYGEELLSHSASTMAATYEMSNRYPLLLLDNLETGNMIPELTDFLLIAATGGMKVKRRVSADRGVIMERADCLVLTNGIEPFNRHELIDRTVEIGLDIRKYGKMGFHESRAFEGLRAGRQKIMSALLFLMAKYVLPRVRKGDLGRIISEFPPHGKERFNEYLALMSIILDAFWGYMPLEAYGRPHDLVSYWLDSQTRALTTQDVGTDDVLYYLNTLHDKHAQILGSSLKFAVTSGGVSLTCTTRELLTDFRVLAKFLGTRCPWSNERQLGTRLADSEKTLTKGGWAREKRRVHGRDEYTYTRREHAGAGDKSRGK